MSIACGSCGGRHESVQEVRVCSSQTNGNLTDIEAEAAAVRRVEVSKMEDDPFPGVDLWTGATESEPGVWSPGPAYYLQERIARERNGEEFPQQGGFGGPTQEERERADWEKRLQGIEEGFYALSEDEIYQVVRSKAGRLYAKLLVETQSGGHWEYAAGAITKLKPEMRMDLDKVSKYGKETGRCLVCSRELTNPDSIAAGIGPICASRF